MDQKHFLFVGETCIASGDTNAILAIFGKLTGENFVLRVDPDPIQAHQERLSEYEFDFGLPLPMLGEIKVVDIDGATVAESFIGVDLPRHDPVVGEQYLVKVQAANRPPVWRPMRHVSHLEKSPLSREVFHFLADGLCYPIARESLMARVMPMAATMQLA